MENAPHVLVLAAGRGTRMRSALPKVLHPALFKPMLHRVLELAQSLPHRSITVVVGHEEAAVREACRGFDVRFERQEPQLGTAHAVRCAEAFLSTQDGDLLILSGDVFLLREETLRALIARHHETGAACTFAAAVLERPRGYGRVIRRDGRVVDVREDKDCSEAERAIQEVNGGIYVFRLADLLPALKEIGNSNAQGEYYLPDAVRLLAARGRPVETLTVGDPVELEGVNDLAALADAELVLRRRVNREAMLQGVRLQEPDSTIIGPGCRFGRDVFIEAGCTLVGAILGDGVVVERGCRVVDSELGEGTRVRAGSVLEKAAAGPRCVIGPSANLRPGARLGAACRAGNFVEIKNSVLGDGAKVSHLSYVGDADIGRNVNIGCGFVTCNYDGVKKSRTVIEDGCFIGSDSQTVAPVRIGAGSYVASGSTVTEDVPPDSLVISRGRQVTKPGYARKYRGAREKSVS